MKKTVGILVLNVVFLTVARQVHAYYASGSERWQKGDVVFHLLLGNVTNGTLSDGSTTWDRVAGDALAVWNQYLDRIQFRTAAVPVNDSTFGDGRNSASWGSTAGGNPFGPNAVAVTRTLLVNGAIAETDVYFNTAFTWDSYRGARRQSVVDLRRVAIHEFGHAFGLSHPDDVGQRVDAIMNANSGDLDTVAADDIAGARALYGHLFRSGVDLGGSWYWFEKLGYINAANYDFAADEGWVYHQQLGWLYLIHAGSGNIYWWDLVNGWQFTSLNSFPYLYNFATNSWWFFDTSSGLPGQRWFYDFGTGQWLSR